MPDMVERRSKVAPNCPIAPFASPYTAWRVSASILSKKDSCLLVLTSLLDAVAAFWDAGCCLRLFKLLLSLIDVGDAIDLGDTSMLVYA